MSKNTTSIAALYQEWQRAYADHEAACDRYSDAEERHLAAGETITAAIEASDPELRDSEVAASVACDREVALAEQIVSAPVTDAGALAIKLHIIGTYVDPQYEPDGEERHDFVYRLAVRALRALEARQGTLIPGAPAAHAAPVAAIAAE